MTDQLALDLLAKHLVTDQLVLTVGYDMASLSDAYTGAVTVDRYGRKVPKDAHGSINLNRQTSSAKMIVEAMMTLFDRIVKPELLIRRMYVVANHIVAENKATVSASSDQPDLFTDYEALARQEAAETAELEKERRLQLAVLDIKKKLGKNAVLKGMNLLDGATAKSRNEQIGGHRK
jgi:DNA polymerase V